MSSLCFTNYVEILHIRGLYEKFYENKMFVY